MTPAKGTKWPKTCHQSATSTTSKTLTSHCDSLTQPTSIQVSVLAHFYFHLHHLVNFQLSFNMSKHSRRASASCRSTCTRNTKDNQRHSGDLLSFNIYFTKGENTEVQQQPGGSCCFQSSSTPQALQAPEQMDSEIQSLCHVFSSTNLVASLTFLLS